MKLEMYSIYDIKSKIFTTPRYAINENTAKRMFYCVFNENKSMYKIFPNDYQVFKIGTFDDVTAEIILEARPTFMWQASEFVTEPDNENKSMLLQEIQADGRKEF